MIYVFRGKYFWHWPIEWYVSHIHPDNLLPDTWAEIKRFTIPMGADGTIMSKN